MVLILFCDIESIGVFRIMMGIRVKVEIVVFVTRILFWAYF